MLLLRRKSTAARAPALTPVANSAAAPAAAAGPATIESLGQQLREILPTRRLHSVSLCDHEANVLWLSEGALGPDEHGLVVEALGLLNEDHTLQCHEMAVEDGRLALFLPVRAPTGKLVGIAMILADSKSIGDDTLERMAAAPVRAIMLRLAVLLKPGDLAAAASGAPPALPSVELPELDPFDLIPADSGAPPAAKARPQAVPDAADDAISAEEVNDILEFELTPEDTMHNVPALRAAAAGSAVRSSETSSEMLSLEFLDAAPATGAALRRVAPPAAPPSAPAPQAAAPAPAPVIAPAAPVIPVVKAAAPAPAPKIEAPPIRHRPWPWPRRRPACAATPCARCRPGARRDGAAERRRCDDPDAAGAERPEPAARDPALREAARRRAEPPLPGAGAQLARAARSGRARRRGAAAPDELAGRASRRVEHAADHLHRQPVDRDARGRALRAENGRRAQLARHRRRVARLRDHRGTVHAAPRAGGALPHPVREGGLLVGDGRFLLRLAGAAAAALTRHAPGEDRRQAQLVAP